MITKKDTAQVAHLAKIALTPEEEEGFTAELGAILGFVEQMSELDAQAVAPVNGGTDFFNVMREDETEDKLLEGKSAELLRAVPDKKENWIRVKSVFE